MTDPNHQSQFYIASDKSLDPDHVTRLKQADTFGVFDRAGDIVGFKGNSDGIYFRDTRHLSHFEMRINGAKPLVLTSAMQNDNSALLVDLTNPDFLVHDKIALAKDTIHIQRMKFMWNGAVYERFSFHNYGEAGHLIKVSFTFGADFADLFEARGQHRSTRGDYFEPQVEGASVTFRYLGLDRVARATCLSFHPRPAGLDRSSAFYALDLPRRGSARFTIRIDCNPRAETEAFDDVDFISSMVGCRRALSDSTRRAPRIVSSETAFDDIMTRSHADLAMLVTETPEGLYPYAGVPWFSTPFGRDGLITALFTVWYDPDLAKGVLRFLAARQAQAFDAYQDAEPGKILHELRSCEMAATREIPFGTYYGSVDSTPLFVVLAGRYLERTGDLDTVRGLWPAILAALDWIENHGDADGDGFVEYARQNESGLVNQGWKDSHDSISHEDGELATGPIALVEVQAYAYGAWRAAQRIAARLGGREAGEVAAHARRRADILAERFDAAFWLEDLGTFALALDGEKRPCRVVSSNAGHAMLTGLARPERALRLAETLLGADMFSGWGIRTLSASAARYNPMSYHNGSVWPHDNAMIALGFAGYGLHEPVERIFEGLTAAAGFLPLNRLPELFCGFARVRRSGPVGYPVACAPQAWAATTPIALVAACLGLSFENAVARLTHPALPGFLDRLDCTGIRDAHGPFSIEARRQDVRIVREGDSDEALRYRVG